jgi:hypothetical protein
LTVVSSSTFTKQNYERSGPFPAQMQR